MQILFGKHPNRRPPSEPRPKRVAEPGTLDEVFRNADTAAALDKGLGGHMKPRLRAELRDERDALWGANDQFMARTPDLAGEVEEFLDTVALGQEVDKIARDMGFEGP